MQYKRQKRQATGFGPLCHIYKTYHSSHIESTAILTDMFN